MEATGPQVSLAGFTHPKQSKSWNQKAEALLGLSEAGNKPVIERPGRGEVLF